MPNSSSAVSVPGQLLAALKARKFNTASKLFETKVDFQAWTNVGHWVAEDAATAAKIMEVWFTPGALPSTVTYQTEATSKAGATLEYEMTWTAPPDDQPRTLRQVFIMTLNKSGKVGSVRVYCPGLHAEFPEVDLEKQRRQKGLAAPAKTGNSRAPVAVKAS